MAQEVNYITFSAKGGKNNNCQVKAIHKLLKVSSTHNAAFKLKHFLGIHYTPYSVYLNKTLRCRQLGLCCIFRHIIQIMYTELSKCNYVNTLAMNLYLCRSKNSAQLS